MTTSMHRLQISLLERQVAFLVERARRDGVSLAEVIRRLIEAAASPEGGQPVGAGAALAEARTAYQVAARSASVELVLDLSPDLYQRLRRQAVRAGKSAPLMAREWVVERLAAEPLPEIDERERVTQILRAAGMLVELDPELKKRADPTISLDEVCASLDRACGKPLSEIILEQRGPKA